MEASNFHLTYRSIFVIFFNGIIHGPDFVYVDMYMFSFRTGLDFFAIYNDNNGKPNAEKI